MDLAMDWSIFWSLLIGLPPVFLFVLGFGYMMMRIEKRCGTGPTIIIGVPVIFLLVATVVGLVA